LAGKGAFSDLLDVFDEVGKSHKAQLQKKFTEIAKKQIDYS